MTQVKFARQIALFGELGQERIAKVRCVIIGVGGLGTQLIMQLALLGVRHFVLIDDQELSETNRNRYYGVRHDDPVPGFRKVDLGERIAHNIDPTIVVEKIFGSFISEAGFAAMRSADIVFGCLDLEGARLVLNDVCTAYGQSYIDLASDVIPGEEPEYGGRVCVSMNGDGCIQCLGVLDTKEAGADLAGEAERRNRAALYGVDRAVLGRSGPSVVSINGVIASLAVTEFMVAITNLREPRRVLTYKGSSGKVFASTDQPSADCYFCKGRWGVAAEEVRHYLADGTAEKLRQSENE
jgi:ThiF family protein